MVRVSPILRLAVVPGTNEAFLEIRVSLMKISI